MERHSLDLPEAVKNIVGHESVRIMDVNTKREEIKIFFDTTVHEQICLRKQMT